jgi:thiol:disulfide interchange protein DsbD
MGFWVIIFTALTLYLFGVIRFPHDSPRNKLSARRWIIALSSFAATIYLASGFLYNKELHTYSSLKLMSGLAPPAYYNYLLPKAVINNDIKSKYPSFTKCANNLDCFKNYFEGLAYAKEVNKPMLVDFTGYGCVNCRKTEEHIWVDDKVRNKIAHEFVLVSLYVDDRAPLEKELYSAVRKTPLRNVGNKWADFQIVNFNQNSQPLYVMVSPTEQVLAKPRGYKEGVDSYAQFLECGLDAFKKTSSIGDNSNF